MQTLLILRHAKSDWNHPDLSDHDRPLNKRGQKVAPQMAKLIATKGFSPQLILSSTAARAKSTALVVSKACPQAEVSFHKNLYLAAPEDIVKVIQEVKTASPLLIVGHNPGLEELVYALTGKEEFFPTAALAVIEIDIENWNELKLEPQHPLKELLRPKEVLT